MAFWNDVRTEPKRQFRFELSFTKLNQDSGKSGIPAWAVKTASKPKANVSTIEHQYIDHTFKYPGRVTWDPITVTLVDPINPDVSYTMLEILGASGYKFPTTDTAAKNSLSKRMFKDAIGSIYIDQIDEFGATIERWELVNPFITSIDFGGSLDYSSDEMNEITVELTFDWAKMMRFGKAQAPSSVGS